MEGNISFTMQQRDYIRFTQCEGCEKGLREVYENGGWTHWIAGLHFECAATKLRKAMAYV